ncbi:MAG: hypothetical protein AAF430_22805 [Myxococcota bacterium]
MRSTLVNRLVPAALCAVVLALPTAGLGVDYLPEPEQAAWAERLAEAHEAIDEANRRVEKARAAYTEARHERHPRGAALKEIETEFRDAQRDAAEAQREFDALLERARPAGVLPEVLRPYL